MDDLGEWARGRNTGEDWKWIGCTGWKQAPVFKSSKIGEISGCDQELGVWFSFICTCDTFSYDTFYFLHAKKKLSQSQTDVKLQRGTMALSSEGCRLHATIQAFSEVSEADGFVFIFITF